MQSRLEPKKVGGDIGERRVVPGNADSCRRRCCHSQAHANRSSPPSHLRRLMCMPTPPSVGRAYPRHAHAHARPMLHRAPKKKIKKCAQRAAPPRPRACTSLGAPPCSNACAALCTPPRTNACALLNAPPCPYACVPFPSNACAPPRSNACAPLGVPSRPNVFAPCAAPRRSIRAQQHARGARHRAPRSIRAARRSMRPCARIVTPTHLLHRIDVQPQEANDRLELRDARRRLLPLLDRALQLLELKLALLDLDGDRLDRGVYPVARLVLGLLLGVVVHLVDALDLRLALADLAGHSAARGAGGVLAEQRRGSH
eukprot:362961-Chlamydomonas_euryale.AAC.2